MKFLTVSVILSFLACIAFTVVCLVMTRNGYEVSDSLIQWFFTTFGVEFAAAAAIRISKHRIQQTEIDEKLNRIKENGLEVSKSDLKPNDNDYYYNDYDYTEGTDSVG